MNNLDFYCAVAVSDLSSKVNCFEGLTFYLELHFVFVTVLEKTLTKSEKFICKKCTQKADRHGMA